MTVVRFTPASTGHLYLSSARIALANARYAAHTGGRLVLRWDDLDDISAVEDSIRQDLAWLGFTPHLEIRLSDRADLYNSAIERLKQAGRLYPCFESEDELRAKADYRRKRGLATVYDRAMLKLTPAQRETAMASGKRPYWRFQLSDTTLPWRDVVLGRREVRLQTVSDPVVVLADGRPAQILAEVVDDIDLRTTHAIRAQENLSAAAAQIDLRAALGGDPRRLRYADIPPLAEDSRARGERRLSSASVRTLRADGVLPGALETFLLGPAFRLEAMTAGDMDFPRLLLLNRAALATADFNTVAAFLPEGATATFWNAIRGAIDLLREARGWWDVAAGSIVPPVIEGSEPLLRRSEALLPEEPWDEGTWSAWRATINEATDESLDAVLRLALTGEDEGPDLAPLLPLIGRARTALRLRLAAGGTG